MAANEDTMHDEDAALRKSRGDDAVQNQFNEGSTITMDSDLNHPEILDKGSKHSNSPTLAREQSRKPFKRSGKWSKTEELYVKDLISKIANESIALPPGQSIRAFLAEKLHCNPMRISKKFPGTRDLMRKLIQNGSIRNGNRVQAEDLLPLGEQAPMNSNDSASSPEDVMVHENQQRQQWPYQPSEETTMNSTCPMPYQNLSHHTQGAGSAVLPHLLPMLATSSTGNVTATNQPSFHAQPGAVAQLPMTPTEYQTLLRLMQQTALLVAGIAYRQSALEANMHGVPTSSVPTNIPSPSPAPCSSSIGSFPQGTNNPFQFTYATQGLDSGCSEQDGLSLLSRIAGRNFGPSMQDDEPSP